PRVMQLARKAKGEVLLFGLTPKATIRAEDIKEKEQKIYFTLIYAAEKVAVELNVPGRFMILNALAAAAVGSLLGLSSKTVKAGLEAFKPVSGRMNILHLPNGVHLIDDTYNANPESMEAALTTLKNIETTGRRIFVAGDMLELGPQAHSLHSKVGAAAARSGIDRLYASGEFDAAVAAGAQDEGLQSANTITGSHDEIIEDLISWLRPGDWALVKGSRGMTMEKVVQGLKAWGQKTETNNE
ncbi:MAG: UDP-N-acetylmuramoyl-tripeptide--D-alanyl-D-alanine ligase, partial [Desulfobacterales bacterium]|nr:UDP-N-acetylmuramoyl-tripeptide--D-alanyl-D-alanine ligase [Desulfobacterales bacterium]